jgi:hypothetical protein
MYSIIHLSVSSAWSANPLGISHPSDSDICKVCVALCCPCY